MAHQVRERVAPHLRSYAHPTGKPTAIRIIIIIPIRPIIIQYQHPKKPTAYSYKKLVHTISSFSTPINKPTAVAAV